VIEQDYLIVMLQTTRTPPCAVSLATSMRRVRPRYACAVVASCVAGGCASTPPPAVPEPAYEPAAAVGLSLKIRMPVKVTSRTPDVVFFAQIEDGTMIDSLSATTPIHASTYCDGEHVYLLNVEPGRWVAVAAMYATQKSEQQAFFDEMHAAQERFQRQQRSDLARMEQMREAQRTGKRYGTSSDTAVDSLLTNVARAFKHSRAPFLNDPLQRMTTRVYFTRELIEQSLVDVTPRSFTFMGRLVADQSLLFGDRDALQELFFTRIEGDPDRSGLAKMLVGESSRSASLHEAARDPATERAFLDRALRRCTGTGWTPLIEKRRTSLF
jgi:hypothetical protein